MLIDDVPRPSQEHPDPRDELVDGPLRVEEWPLIATRFKRNVVEIPEGAPSWWKGDEAATTDFLRAVGARIEPDGTVVKR